MYIDRATETEECLSPSEICLAIQGMAEVDVLRLKMIAERYAARCPMDADDLIQQAFVEALSGDRRCPRDVPLVAFLAQTMRSVAFNERRKDKFICRFESSGDDDASDDLILLHPDSGPSPEAIAMAEEAAEDVFKLFKDDDDVGMLLMGIYDGMSPDEICKLNDWSRTTYDTVRKRLKRKLNNRFPQGRQT